MNGNDTRKVVLGRISRALSFAQPDSVEVPRDYDRVAATGVADTKRFIEMLTEYQVRVASIDANEIAASIASLVRPGGQVVVPHDVPTPWTSAIETLTDRPEKPLTVEELNESDAVVTGCALAISATGTIVLDAGPAQGRRAITLLPDHHICVVFTGQIVDTLPQAFAALNPTRPLTFISGPSATSDIELTRVAGVHGPRTLDVLLIDDR